MLSRDILAMSFFNALKALVFLPALLDEAASDKVLQLFIGAEAEHLFSAAHCVALLQPIIDEFKQVVEAEELVVRTEHVHQFIGNMIGEST